MGLGLFHLRRTPGSATPSCRRWQDIATPAPCQRFIDNALRPGPDGSAPTIDDEVILRVAKEICAGNGGVWGASELHETRRWERNKIVVDEAGRRKYIALAREELFKESGDE